MQKNRSYRFSLAKDNEIQFVNFKIILIELFFSCGIKSICDIKVFMT